MTTDNYYGIRSADLEQTKQQIEAALGVKFQRHESDYRGGDYFRCEDSIMGCLILQRNIDVIDNAPAIEGFSQWPILLYTFGLANASNIDVLLSEYRVEYEPLQSRTSRDD